MSIVTERKEVVDIYAEAAGRHWVIPAFGSENLTTTEAVLSAVKEYGERSGIKNLPITIAITNLYDHRSQSTNYTHTKDWKTGLKLFLADLQVLAGKDSPYADLNVMIHLDHIQPEDDKELLSWDMGQFSSIMFDASVYPWEENLKRTAEFVEKNRDKIVIEGACDEIIDAGGNEVNKLTDAQKALDYVQKTDVDFIVANLGTEHRASSSDLKYHGDLAEQIRDLVGTKLVLHGCSSVSQRQLQTLFLDGICKVNIWTILERDSSPVLFENMVKNAAKAAGTHSAAQLAEYGYLGTAADITSQANLGYFTTVYRQDIIFNEMKKIVDSYLKLFYSFNN